MPGLRDLSRRPFYYPPSLEYPFLGSLGSGIDGVDMVTIEVVIGHSIGVFSLAKSSPLKVLAQSLSQIKTLYKHFTF
jgi:hypothetical protein